MFLTLLIGSYLDAGRNVQRRHDPSRKVESVARSCITWRSCAQRRQGIVAWCAILALPCMLSERPRLWVCYIMHFLSIISWFCRSFIINSHVPDILKWDLQLLLGETKTNIYTRIVKIKYGWQNSTTKSFISTSWNPNNILLMILFQLWHFGFRWRSARWWLLDTIYHHHYSHDSK